MTNSTEQEEGTSVTSVISICPCRICQTAKSREDLISPCLCKGSLGKVHLSCLERWLNMCGRQYCEICRFEFQAVKKRRYGLCQSIRIWVRHPRHGMLLRSDLIVAAILTVVTIGLVAVCLLGMQYFVTEGLKLGVPALYSQGVILTFLSVIVVGYAATLYLMAKDHIRPWYRWWSRCMIISIIIAPEMDDLRTRNTRDGLDNCNIDDNVRFNNV